VTTPAEAIAPVKVRKPRGPRKSTVEAMALARREGYDEGFVKGQHVATADRWPGAVAATLLALAAFAAGAWWF
jgi:hypothetical protein